MLKKKILFIFIFSLAVFSDNCTVTKVNKISNSNGFSPMKILLSGSKLLAHGGNFVKIFDVSNPSNPIELGATENLSFKCGDTNFNSFDIGIGENDNIVFLGTKCKGTRAYDFSQNTSNPPCVGKSAEFMENTSVAGAKIGTKRYAFFGKSPGFIMYADYTNPPGGCNEVIGDAIGYPISNFGQLLTFKDNNKTYLTVNYAGGKFYLFDITNFPPLGNPIMQTNDAVYSSFIKDGKVYLNTRNGGLKIYDINTKQLVGSYSNYDYSMAMGIYVDDSYIYLGLGTCQQTGGFVILNSSLQKVFDGLTPTDCGESTIMTDIIVLDGLNNKKYLYISAITNIPIYEISCGDSVNFAIVSIYPSQVYPNKNYSLQIKYKNTGNIPAHNVYTTLKSNSSYITIATTTPNHYNIINAGETKTENYDISVLQNAPPGVQSLRLEITTAEGNFNLPVNIEILEVSAMIERTSVSKDPYENKIEVKYENVGDADFNGYFDVYVKSFTLGVNFTESTKRFSNIPAHSFKTNTYSYVTNIEDPECSVINFISMNLKESPSISLVPEENLNVSIVAGSYPFLTIESTSLSKEGENYKLTVPLKNLNLEAYATNVSVHLTSDMQDLIWQENPVYYGTVSNISSKNFYFSVPSGSTGIVNFIAKVKANEGCWKYEFAHDLADLKFEYKDEKHCTCSGRCTTDHPDIYEGTEDQPACIEFYFKLKNTGTSDAVNIPATLEIRDGNPNVSLISNVQYYNLSSGEEDYNDSPFKLTINSNFCSGDDSTCPKLKLRLKIPEYNFTKDLDFTVKASGGSNPPPASCNLRYTGNLTISNDTNGNKTAEPGERISFYIEIQNTGNASAPNVIAKISKDSSKAQYINLEDYEASFGTISAGSSSTNSSNPFIISLTNDAPTGYYYFPLSISSSCSSSSFSGTVLITVSSSGSEKAKLSFAGYTVEGSSNKSYLEVGKNQILYVSLKNESNVTVQNAQGTLTTTENLVQITSQGIYSSIPPGKVGTAPFGIFISEGFTGNSIRFKIEVQNAIIEEPYFNVPVGSSQPPPTTFQAFTIPIIVHAAGTNNTYWKSDFYIQNPANETQKITLKFLKPEGYENLYPPSVSGDLPPNASFVTEDILADPNFPSFNYYDRGGLLIEYSSQTFPPVASARIYNDGGGNGTYGQFVPSIPVTSKVRGTSGNIPAYLIGLSKNERYRANMGIANVSSSENILLITLINRLGYEVGTQITKKLGPYNIAQINDIASAAEIPGNLESFTVKVESLSKADFVAWGSIVDNKTGDASFVNDQIQQNKKTLIMGVAHSKGAQNTNWRTDLYVYNPSSYDLNLVLTYYKYGSKFRSSAEFYVKGGGTLIIEDVISYFDGISESESGYIIAYPKSTMDKNPIISARTYNLLDNGGTYGQFVSGINYENGFASSNQKLIFNGVTINNKFRSNLGIVNGDESNINTVYISLYTKEGDFLSQFTRQLNPMEGLQIPYNEIQKYFGSFENYTIVVQGTTKTFAYVSKIDNISSDPIFMLPAIR